MVAQTAESALATAQRLYARLAARRDEVHTLDAYFDGAHPLAFASDTWARDHAARFKGFADNWCGVVGSAPAERTEVAGFRLGRDADVMSDDERELWKWWEVNEGPAIASQGFLTTVITKRSTVMVWGTKNDEPVITWEHPSQVYVDRDPSNHRVVRSALKAWVEDDEQERMTLQTPEAVWKWTRPVVAGQVVNGRTSGGLYIIGAVHEIIGGGWKPYQPADDDTWPLPNPLGEVGAVEFENRPRLAREPLSDIAGTMAMQNAINLLWAYLFSAADFASMPARVVMGQEPPKVPILDENGQKIGDRPVDQESLKQGRLLWLTGQNTKIGQWESAKLDVFTGVITHQVKHVSAQTRTPLYLVHGELGNVNGETLTALDTPLNDKVREGHKFHTPRVRDMFRLNALVLNKKDVAEACRTGNVQWRNPATRSDSQVSDAALKDRQIGWSFAGILEKRYGMSQTEIDREIGRVQAERRNPYLDAMKDPAQDGADPSAVGA